MSGGGDPVRLNDGLGALGMRYCEHTAHLDSDGVGSGEDDMGNPGVRLPNLRRRVNDECRGAAERSSMSPVHINLSVHVGKPE
jgi:hypothetical protein